MNVEYWIEREYSMEDAKSEASNFQKESNSKLVELYNDEEFLIRIRPKQNNRVEYYLAKGYTLEESKAKLKERQSTFSMKSCIDKFGIKEGPILWKGRQDKWLDSLSKNRKLKIGYSAVSQELFNIILEKLSNSRKKHIKYASHNRELCLYTGSRIYLYDFADIKSFKIIEFNGDVFHANPSKYKSDECPNPFLKETKSSDIWESDRLKCEHAKSKGYDVLTIWEDEYRKNKELVIEKCLIFLKK